MAIEMGRTYRTRDGRAVTIYGISSNTHNRGRAIDRRPVARVLGGRAELRIEG